MKAWLLAFVWEATWIEAGQKEEELPHLFRAIELKNQLKEPKGSMMYHVAYDETGIGMIASGVKDGDD